MRNNAAEKLLSTANSQGLSIVEDAFAEYMDSIDPLREHREAFFIPKAPNGADCVYLCGNSLGLQHRDVEASVCASLRKWREQGVKGNVQPPNPWLELDKALKREMAVIVGAQESEVIIMNSFTTNIHFMLMAFYKPTGRRRKILAEHHPLPTDTHALISQLEVRGLDPAEDLLFVGAPSPDAREASPAVIKTEQFLAAMEKHGEEIAVLVLGAVHCITGQVFDIPTICQAAHAKGILVGVDCAHAAGNIPLALHDWDVDFACWSTYQYLNGGPGNLGAAFVHARHTLPGAARRGLRGLGGRSRQTEPPDGAAAFQLSGANPAALAALGPGVRLMARLGMPALRDKSALLAAYLELLLDALVPAGAARVMTPADPKQRGAAIALRVAPNRRQAVPSLTEPVGADGEAEGIVRQLDERGVVVECGPSDTIRLAPVPLYNSFTDVLLAVRELANCLM